MIQFSLPGTPKPMPTDDSPLPPEYGRVTNAERFRPLHDAAERRLAAIEAEYLVSRCDDIELPDVMKAATLTRPVIGLRSPTPGSAPLAVAFTALPGLIVHTGWGHALAFPACGCDACNEEADDQIEQFEALVESVITGTVREAITFGRWGLRHEATISGATGLSIGEAVALAWREKALSRVWRPWERRAR